MINRENIKAQIDILPEEIVIGIDKYIAGQLKKNTGKSKQSAEDEYLLALALERMKNDNGVRWSCEDIRRRHGITQEDIDNAEDVEIE